MASKKKGLVKFCKIFQWVERQDPDLAGAISQLCLEKALSCNPAGTTFLYPGDAAFRREIVDKAFSADADEACRLIQSLILPDAFARGTDFGRRPVGTCGGVRLAVESATDARVRFAGGLEIVPLAPGEFDLLASHKGRAAIWRIAAGRPPLTGEPYAAPRPAEGKVGGARRLGGGAGAPGFRAALACAVEADYDRCMRLDRCRSCNPFLAKVVSLLNYLKGAEPDAWLRVAPVLDYEPVVCFYLLVEPHKTRGEYLISDDALCAWGGCDEFADAVAEYEGAFRHAQYAAAPGGAGALAFRDRAGVAAEVDRLRQAFGALNPRDGPRFVQEAYATFSAQNAVGGRGPVLPPAAAAALAHPKKLWQDEFRFTLFEALQSLRGAPYEPGALAGVLCDVRLGWPGNDYAAEARLTNVEDLKASVSSRAELLLLTKFVNSTDFLYTPPEPDAVGPPASSMDPRDGRVYNRNAAALAGLRRVAGMSRPGEVSAQTERELRRYVQAHGGQLPPSVLALAGGGGPR